MQTRFDWLRERKRWFQWSGIGLLVSGCLAFIVGAYAFHWSWTGFNKTFWDWMQLLIIPAALALAGFLFNQAERRSRQIADRQQAELERQAAERRVQWEQQLSAQRATTERFLAQWRLEVEMKQKEEYQREALLQAYLDRMADLLIEKGLRTSVKGDEVRSIARARTLTALQRLDPERKAEVLWFLYESRLLGSQNTERIVDVSDADWSHIRLDESQLGQIDLSYANLSHASMRGINLAGANLEGTAMCQADLQEAILRGAKLRNADLTAANLTGADLTNAHLQKTNLSRSRLAQAILRNSTMRDAVLHQADFSRANLQGTFYTQEQLAAARGTWSVQR